MKDFKYDELTLKFNTEDAIFRITWLGSIHAANPSEFLDPVINDIMEFLDNTSLKVVSDFKKLDYMNSSSIPVLVSLLRRLSDKEISSEFIYDKTRMVQVASFKALNVIASKSGIVKIVGE